MDTEANSTVHGRLIDPVSLERFLAKRARPTAPVPLSAKRTDVRTSYDATLCPTHARSRTWRRRIFRDLIDMPADVTITEHEVEVRFHRRAHLSIIAASGLLDEPVAVPWWNGMSLRMRV